MGVIARMEAAWDGGGEGAVSTESLGAALGAGRGREVCSIQFLGEEGPGKWAWVCLSSSSYGSPPTSRWWEFLWVPCPVSHLLCQGS